MRNKECEIVRDLLPLYADGVVSGPTLEFVEAHLATCGKCKEMLEVYQQPVLPGRTVEAKALKSSSFARRLHWVATALVIVAVFVTSTIAWASFQAGRNLTLSDPSFRQAEQLGLFTEVNQSENMGPYNITVDRILLDTVRTTVHYRLDPGLKGDAYIQLAMVDDKGVHYDPRGGRGLQGKHFVYDLEPVNLNAEKLILSFNTEEFPGEARFEIPVDPTLVAENTREIYPDLRVAAGPVELALDRAVLGVSESIFFFRARWPREGEIAGVSIGQDTPMYMAMGPQGLTMAESRVSFPRPVAHIQGAGGQVSDNYANLVDLTNAKKVKLNSTRTGTDPITGGITGAFHFEPVDTSARVIKLDLPPLYQYRLAEEGRELELTWPRQGELAVSKVFHGEPASFILARAAREEDKLALYFKYMGGADVPHRDIHPDFRIKDQGHWTRQAGLEWLEEDYVKVLFHLPEADTVILSLRGVGERLPQVSFDINVSW